MWKKQDEKISKFQFGGKYQNEIQQPVQFNFTPLAQDESLKKMKLCSNETMGIPFPTQSPFQYSYGMHQTPPKFTFTSSSKTSLKKDPPDEFIFGKPTKLQKGL